MSPDGHAVPGVQSQRTARTARSTTRPTRTTGAARSATGTAGAAHHLLHRRHPLEDGADAQAEFEDFVLFMPYDELHMVRVLPA